MRHQYPEKPGTVPVDCSVALATTIISLAALFVVVKFVGLYNLLALVVAAAFVGFWVDECAEL